MPELSDEEVMDMARAAVQACRVRHPNASEQEIEAQAMVVLEATIPILNREETAVRELGDRVGYGRIMQLCEQIWSEKLQKQGLEGGEHTHLHMSGPCAGFMVPCPGEQHEEDHPDHPHCDWCCGSHRVTQRVAQAITGEKPAPDPGPGTGPSRYEVITSEEDKPA